MELTLMASQVVIVDPEGQQKIVRLKIMPHVRAHEIFKRNYPVGHDFK